MWMELDILLGEFQTNFKMFKGHYFHGRKKVVNGFPQKSMREVFNFAQNILVFASVNRIQMIISKKHTDDDETWKLDR